MSGTEMITRSPVRIRPAEPSFLPGISELHELWHARSLLAELVRRDVRIRYAQTVLGAAWAILQPLTMLAIFTLVFGMFVRLPSDGVPYALVALTGLVPWIYFATVVAASSDSLVASRELITKIYFPRLVIPLAPVLASFADLIIGLAVLLVGIYIWGSVPIGPAVLLLPIPLLVMMVAALGIGTLATALNVQYRDIRYVIPFFIQAGLFASPVIYPLSIVPENLRLILALNPMTGVIESLRVMLLATGPMPWAVVMVSTFTAFLLLFVGVGYFRHVEHRFADLA